MFFFEFMNRRYEHASTVLTSNEAFDEWGEVFADEVIASALIDPLVQHGHIVLFAETASECGTIPISQPPHSGSAQTHLNAPGGDAARRSPTP